MDIEFAEVRPAPGWAASLRILHEGFAVTKACSMSGPAASILLPVPVSAVVIEAVRKIIAGFADTMVGQDFRIDGQPFAVTFTPEYPGELEGIVQEENLHLVLGWIPRGIIGVVAHCSGNANHRFLAILCVRLSRELDGVVDLGGELPVGPVLPEAAGTPPVRASLLGGVLFATSYQTAAGRFATCHYCDADFLEAWLRHPQFRMVK